jgi:geranylgeranyl diphosphate synthase type I
MPSALVQDNFEEALEAAVTRHDQNSPIDAMIRYHFGYEPGSEVRRGKRLRPRLLFTVAEEEGGSADGAMDAACAIEILHNYSLVHDDIEDRDRLRHGREAAWARFGIAHGINAGDSLCAISYLALVNGTTPRSVEQTLAMIRVLHEANFAMCIGQGRDIAFESAQSVTMDDYIAMIAGKTAALFGAACELGALAAGASAERAGAYARLGRAYGIAFQIEDDVLGTWGDSALTGKPSGADVARRKWTFPVVWALGGEPSRARTTIERAYANDALDDDAVRAAIAALDTLGAREAAIDAAQRHFAALEDVARDADIDRETRVRSFLRSTVLRTA